MKIIDLSFNTTPHIPSISEALRLFKMSYGYVDFIKQRCDIEVILRLGNDEDVMIDSVRFRSFSAKRGSSLLRLLLYLKRSNADVVIVNGLDFYKHTALLQWFLPSTTKLIVRHHAERYPGNNKWLRRYADKRTDAYMFTSFGNAKEWLDNGIIRSQAKCYEVLEASTYMQRQDREQARTILGFPDAIVFVSVARLHIDKDPLTVVKGFEKYLLYKPGARLYMIYQVEDLLSEVQTYINNSTVLKEAVTMVGKVPNEQLPLWYSAADYFISGSHAEGSGYAFIEAMACGCIPVVTDIPSFVKITEGGRYGFHYPKGDADSLAKVLKALDHSTIKQLSADIIAHFKSALSYQKIADDMMDVCEKVRKG